MRTSDQRRVLLLLMIAVSIAAYRRHTTVEDSDLERAARMLTSKRPKQSDDIDVAALIA
jgi:hypothetical protein